MNKQYLNFTHILAPLISIPRPRLFSYTVVGLILSSDKPLNFHGVILLILVEILNTLHSILFKITFTTDIT